MISPDRPGRTKPGAARDISGRREAEASLRESETRLREFNETLEREVNERTAERDRIWEISPDLQLVIDFKGVFRRGSAREGLSPIRVQSLRR